MTACRSRSGTCERTPTRTWYLAGSPSWGTEMIRCRSSGSPTARVVSAVIARSRIVVPVPGYHRWAGSHVASVSSNVMTPGLPRPSLVIPADTAQISQTATQIPRAAGWALAREVARPGRRGPVRAESGRVARRVAFAACPGRGLLSAAQVDAALAADPHDFSVVDLVPLEITPQPGGDSAMPEADVAAIAGGCAGRSRCS